MATQTLGGNSKEIMTSLEQGPVHPGAAVAIT